MSFDERSTLCVGHRMWVEHHGQRVARWSAASGVGLFARLAPLFPCKRCLEVTDR